MSTWMTPVGRQGENSVTDGNQDQKCRAHFMKIKLRVTILLDSCYQLLQKRHFSDVHQENTSLWTGQRFHLGEEFGARSVQASARNGRDEI